MSYLRFTPQEYQVLGFLGLTLRFADNDLPAFRRMLVQALSEDYPQLAGRITRLRQAEVRLLYSHFRSRPAAHRGHGLNHEEVRLVSKLCRAAPFNVRMAKPFKRLLLEMLEPLQPELARKVAALSGYQFERLYNQAVGRGVVARLSKLTGTLA